MFEFPGPVDDVTLARLPFYEAQQQLAGALVPRSGGTYVDVEWHGTGTDGDPELGSFVIVKEGGPHEDLIGDRLRLTVGDRRVVAYCHTFADLDDDLSVTRNLFIRLGALSLPSVTAWMEVIG